MDAFLMQCFGWVLRSSWQTAILILAVLIAQRLLRRQLNAQWRFNLWLLVLVRLLLPFSPESGLSVFNVIKPQRVPLPASLMLRAEPVSPIAEQTNENHSSIPQKTGPKPIQRDATASEADISKATDESRQPVSLGSANISAPVSVKPTFTAWEIASWIWTVGILGLTLHVMAQVFRTRKHTRNATPVQDVTTLSLFDECRAQMGVRVRVRLMETTLVKSPALCGVLRPCLLLPPGLTSDFSSQELRYIFLHELAHVKRRDVSLNWLLAVLQILHWFNPIIWIGFSKLRADRELACDALAIASAPDGAAKEYGRTVIKLLETFSRPSVLPGIVGIMEDKHQMERRIRMIAAFKKTRRWSVPALVLMLALAVTGLTDAVKPKEAKTPKTESKEMTTVIVIDAETGAPIKGASVVFPFGNEISDFTPPLPIHQTDEKGITRLPREPFVQGFGGIGVLNAEHSPLGVGWFRGTDAQGRAIEPEIPHQYTVKLDRGSNIGGVVVDETGKPIPNVRVEIRASTEWLRGGLKPTGVEYPFYNNYFSAYNPVFGACPVTDTEGRWQCSHFPKQIEVIELRLFLPDHSCRQFYTGDGGSMPLSGDSIKMADLRDKNVKLVVRKGIDVHGVVVDPEGKPISGITLTEIDGRKHVKPLAVLSTGSDGRFLLPNRDPHQIMLKASGTGFATNPTVVNIRPDMPEVRIEMLPAIPLRIRVVDPSGQPVEKASVGIGGMELGWRGESGRDGRVVWNDAPREALKYHGYQEKYGFALQEITPDGTEQTIMLRKGDEQKVFVTVKAETSDNLPLDAFTVFGVRKEASPVRIGEGKAGVFSGAVSANDLSGPEFRIKVEAPGREPLTTHPLQNWNGEISTSVTLRKAGPLEGVILQPDGTPAAKAHILINTEEQNGYIGIEFRPRGRGERSLDVPEARSNHLQTVRADEAGHYSFNPPNEQKACIVTHKNGFLETTIAQLQRSPELHLKPWGRIEGTLTENGKPKPEQRLELLFKRRSDYYLSVSYYISTDKNGYFVFDKVPPGDCTLTSTKPSKGIWPRNHPFPVTVVAGETTKVAYGSTGRTVTGRLRTLPAGVEIDWAKAVTTNLLSRKIVSQRLALPAFSDFVRMQDYQAAVEQWRKTPIESPIQDTYALEFEADGSFHAEGIPSGTYELEVKLTDPDHPKDGQWQEIGSIKREVIVPPVPNEAEAESVNLGSFEIAIKSEAAPVKPAPPLSGQTAEGKSMRLADYRGKYVLLTFWAPWATPSPEEAAALTDAAKVFGADPRFAMVGIAIEEKPEAIPRGASVEGIPWISASLQGREKATATEAWGVDSLPAMLLVGPEGNILARNLKAARVRPAIQELLKK